MNAQLTSRGRGADTSRIYRNSVPLWVAILLLVLGWGGITPLLAGAEWYVGGYFGATIPNDFSQIQGVGASTGVTQSDLKLKRSGMFGAKVGYFFNRMKWLGIETEAYTTNPHVQQQLTTISAGSTPISTSLTPGNQFQVATWGLNVVIRYPGERFQPYLGVGGGAFYGKFSNIPGNSKSSSDLSPGIVGLGGFRVFVSETVAWFVEYKYNKTTFEFGELGIKGEYSVHHATMGLAYHF